MRWFIRFKDGSVLCKRKYIFDCSRPKRKEIKEFETIFFSDKSLSQTIADNLGGLVEEEISVAEEPVTLSDKQHMGASLEPTGRSMKESDRLKVGFDMLNGKSVSW